jgi:hypothetical protein
VSNCMWTRSLKTSWSTSDLDCFTTKCYLGLEFSCKNSIILGGCDYTRSLFYLTNIFVTSYHPSAIFGGQLSEWAMLMWEVNQEKVTNCTSQTTYGFHIIENFLCSFWRRGWKFWTCQYVCSSTCFWMWNYTTNIISKFEPKSKLSTGFCSLQCEVRYMYHNLVWLTFQTLIIA